MDRQRKNNMPRQGRRLTCHRCGWVWVARIPSAPKRCANCRSPYWQTPRLPAAEQPQEPPSPPAGETLVEGRDIPFDMGTCDKPQLMEQLLVVQGLAGEGWLQEG